MDCAHCGAGTWGCVKRDSVTLCLSCAFARRVGRLPKPPAPITATPSAPTKPVRACVCSRDEACDCCYADKEATWLKHKGRTSPFAIADQLCDTETPT